jgi:hypothetical protein
MSRGTNSNEARPRFAIKDGVNSGHRSARRAPRRLKGASHNCSVTVDLHCRALDSLFRADTALFIE